MSTPETLTFGPCTNWISSEDVAASCDALDSSGDPAVYDSAVRQACEILWAASGRQFSGACGPVTVRPCVSSCGCWGTWAGAYEFWWNVGYGYWIGGGGNGLSAVQGWGACDGGWSNGCCGSLSRVKLDGYPVVSVEQVMIDGNVIDPADYRLDQNKWLTYLDDADGNKRRWPNCQNLGREPGEPGTFTVTYTHGIQPPEIGLQAAVQLACHIARLEGDCELPAGTTRVARQGITVDVAVPGGQGRHELPVGFMSLSLVQLFLATVNPHGLKRRSAAWSPDVERYALRYGQ